jgi:hypothetical protein
MHIADNVIVACRAVSRQRLGKRVPAAMDTHATIEVLLEAVFSTRPLRVVGGDEKGSFEFETVNYGGESHGTRTRERLRWRNQQQL